MTLAKRPNGGELQITQNPSPTLSGDYKSWQVGQSYCKCRLVGLQGAVLDLWEASLYGAT
jgi:hypothetical protein